ncbi:MAG TPA: hypothetical protein VFZ68_03975 [Acidimicrobiales bacterium]
MTMQLTLIEAPEDWHLDEHTRRVGREGVARARAALRQGRATRTGSVAEVPAADRRDPGHRGSHRPAA